MFLRNLETILLIYPYIAPAIMFASHVTITIKRWLVYTVLIRGRLVFNIPIHIHYGVTNTIRLGVSFKKVFKRALLMLLLEKTRGRKERIFVRFRGQKAQVSQDLSVHKNILMLDAPRKLIRLGFCSYGSVYPTQASYTYPFFKYLCNCKPPWQ